jgi:aryl-alcohol dehydrogenase-like predicted oxidoreductase
VRNVRLLEQGDLLARQLERRRRDRVVDMRRARRADDRRRHARLAVDAGITFFDPADMYAGGASEIVTGRLLRKLISRDEAVVSTKVFYPTTPGPNGRGLSRKHVV